MRPGGAATASGAAEVQLLEVGRVPPIAEDLGDPSRSDRRVDAGRLCAWCEGPTLAGARIDSFYCGVVCRKHAWCYGADPNALSAWGQRALHHALGRDNGLPLLGALLEFGADPRDARGRWQRRPPSRSRSTSGSRCPPTRCPRRSGASAPTPCGCG